MFIRHSQQHHQLSASFQVHRPAGPPVAHGVTVLVLNPACAASYVFAVVVVPAAHGSLARNFFHAVRDPQWLGSFAFNLLDRTAQIRCHCPRFHLPIDHLWPGCPCWLLTDCRPSHHSCHHELHRNRNARHSHLPPHFCS